MEALTRRGFLGAVLAVPVAAVLPAPKIGTLHVEMIGPMSLDPFWASAPMTATMSEGIPEWANDGHFRSPYLCIPREIPVWRNSTDPPDMLRLR